MRNESLSLEEYEGSVVELVGASNGGEGMNVVSVGSSVWRRPIEVATGVSSDGAKKMFGIRADLGDVQFQTMTTTPGQSESYAGWLQFGSPSRWHSRIAWSAGDMPSSSDVLLNVGTLTGTARCNGGLGPHGLLLTNVQHVTLSYFYPTYNAGSLRVGWRVLPGGILADAGVRYQATQAELAGLRKLNVNSVTTTLMADPCCAGGAVSAVVDFKDSTIAAQASTARRGQPGWVRAACAIPITTTTRALLRAGQTFDPTTSKGKTEFGVLASFKLKQASCTASIDVRNYVPSVSLQIGL